MVETSFVIIVEFAIAFARESAAYAVAVGYS